MELKHTEERDELSRQRATLHSENQQAKRALVHARDVRAAAINDTRRIVLAQQHEHHRQLVARLPVELRHIQTILHQAQDILTARQAVLDEHLSQCQQDIEEARSAVHSDLANVAAASWHTADDALTKARTSVDYAQQQVQDADGRLRSLAHELQKAITARTTEVQRHVAMKTSQLDEVQRSFSTLLSENSGHFPELTFNAESIQRAADDLAQMKKRAQGRTSFARDWVQYLDQRAEQLRDRLAEYVNLVCATTVGIASDRYFGDRGPFVERQFDLAIVDEAGKVTELEFLVSAVRARRWVLVGDHKQLPPYYDQALDPYLQSATRERVARRLPPIDATPLMDSVFERLWCKFNPDTTTTANASDSARVAPTSTSAAADSPAARSVEDPATSADAAFDYIEQVEDMWRKRHADRAWEEGHRAEQMEKMWRARHTTTERLTSGRTDKDVSDTQVSSFDRHPTSRCVTLDVQRRMHPDLALFVSEMFYGGRYYSPPDPHFTKSKELDLVHFPKPVTFIDVRPGRDARGYEVDLSNNVQRKRHLRAHQDDLPRRGFANPHEAAQVIEVLEALVDDSEVSREQAQLHRSGDRVPAIGVIGLYAGQVALIRKLIRTDSVLQSERLSSSEWLCRGVNVVVNTVDAFQGKECPIIILSFTRSNPRQAVGFVDDPHRLNVALSRARKKLILIGDAETLTRRARESRRQAKETRAAMRERQFFTQLVAYVEGKGKSMRLFERRSVTP